MTNKENSGHAFPTQSHEYDGHNNVLQFQESGMSLRQYAAIKLKVPDSGIDWLDEMIKESRCLDNCQPNIGSL